MKKIYYCECGNKKIKNSNQCNKCKGYSQRRVTRPEIELLKKEIEKLGYRGAGRKYGVSDNAIRKWIK